MKQILESINKETWVICISHSTKNDLLEYKNDIDPEKIIVTHLAASENFYRCVDRGKIASVRRKYKIPEGNYVLSLCTLEPRKNLDTLVKAFAQLVQQEGISDLSLVLAGGKGWDFEQIFQAIKESDHVKQKIFTTGFVPSEDLAPLYSGAMMFVYPSFYEGFGLPPLEAMQCGVPVITSNTSSLPEVVADAGIMVAPVDQDGLSEAMLKLYSCGELRNTLRQKALDHSRSFSWQKCASETAALYGRACGC